VTGARAFEALENTAAEPADPAPADPPLEGADPSVEGAGLAAAGEFSAEAEAAVGSACVAG
jgi:hypothetical protein